MCSPQWSAYDFPEAGPRKQTSSCRLCSAEAVSVLRSNDSNRIDATCHFACS